MRARRKACPVEVLGVYRVAASRELVDRVIRSQYLRVTPKRRREQGPEARAIVRGLLLVEAVLHAPCIRAIGYPTAFAAEQVPWQATLLSRDGRRVVRQLWLDEPDSFPARITFFLHCFDANAPLRVGNVALPLRARTRMPPRLARSIRYQPVD